MRQTTLSQPNRASRTSQEIHKMGQLEPQQGLGQAPGRPRVNPKQLYVLIGAERRRRLMWMKQKVGSSTKKERQEKRTRRSGFKWGPRSTAQWFYAEIVQK